MKRDAKPIASLALAALGVVYGDIGTSPLYALRECFSGSHSVPPTPENVLGVVSLIFYALLSLISIKYLAVVMRADNRGEGGILALMALLQTRLPREPRARWSAVSALALFATGLLFGDGVITPAISVLSAVEGLEVATPALEAVVVPLTVVILVGLFLLQRRGTGGVGAIFGPVMLVWFVTIGIVGLLGVLARPEILAALDPRHAVEFFRTNRSSGFLVLGAVFLVVTGGEALYASMGHFGPQPIRVAWFGLVLPALLLNYFGQGGLLLANPGAAVSPFYLLVPSWGVYPLTFLASAATIIASQALISGVFSLSRQAIQLGYLPRLSIEHTSRRQAGQIYVPAVNWTLMLTTAAVVVGFGSSSDLAAAYGLAVSTDMVITTVLLAVVVMKLWRWPLPAAVLILGFFLVTDTSFFVANLIKVPQGGWFPLLAAVVLFTLMTTWKRGRELLNRRLRERTLPLELLLADIEAEPPIRVPGTAVFMTANRGATPPALVHNLAHNKVLHRQVILLTVQTEDVPFVPASERVEVEELGKGFYWVVGHYGFMQHPDVPDLLERVRSHGLEVSLEATTFFLGRETLVSTPRPGMARWREKLFAFLSRNAQRPAAFFRIPPEQVFEVGVQVEL